MNSQTSKIIMLIGLAGAIAGLTACREMPACHASRSADVCGENLEAGLATITCQPMDVEITNDQPKVAFEVGATGNHRLYQWYYVNPASNTDTPLEESREGRKKYIGVNTPELTIDNPTIADCGFYYCQIETVDCIGFPVRTNTRRAALGYTTRFAMIGELNSFVVVQPLPQPGSSGQPGACTTAAVYSSVTFRNGGAGYQIPPGVHCFDVALTNTITRTGQPPMDASAYQIVVGDVYGVNPPKTYCAMLKTNRWSFTASSGHLYLFSVYFNYPPPAPTAAYPNVALRLNP